MRPETGGVELRWQVRGEIAADYGYSLFAAVCRRLDARLHEDAAWCMSPVLVEAGGVRGDRLTVERGTLAIRCNLGLVPDFAGLYAPTGLAIRETGALQLSPAPTVHVLQPARVLHAERVTIKGLAQGSSELARREFADKVRRRLDRDRVDYSGVRIGAPFSMLVVDQWAAGFAVEIEGLSDRDSLHLQQEGLGGRQRMGCGFLRA